MVQGYDKGGIECVCKNEFRVQQRSLEEPEPLVDLAHSLLQLLLCPMLFCLHCLFPNTHTTHADNCKILKGDTVSSLGLSMQRVGVQS